MTITTQFIKSDKNKTELITIESSGDRAPIRPLSFQDCCFFVLSGRVQLESLSPVFHLPDEMLRRARPSSRFLKGIPVTFDNLENPFMFNGLGKTFEFNYIADETYFLLVNGGWLPVELIHTLRNYTFILDSNAAIDIENKKKTGLSLLERIDDSSQLDLSFFVSEQKVKMKKPMPYTIVAYQKYLHWRQLMDCFTSLHRRSVNISMSPRFQIDLKNASAKFLQHVYPLLINTVSTFGEKSLTEKIDQMAMQFDVQNDLSYIAALSCGLDKGANISLVD